MEGDSGKGSSELTVEGSGGARLTAQPRAVTRGPRLPSGRAKEGKLVWQLRDFGNRPSLPPAPRTLDTDTGSLRAPPAQDRSTALTYIKIQCSVSHFEGTFKLTHDFATSSIGNLENI